MQSYGYMELVFEGSINVIYITFNMTFTYNKNYVFKVF